tara:strand:- start:649 stop:825 length:177 start_codon:yes stop_codon:yes gene_type:complete
MTNLEKASFYLTMQDIYCEEVLGKLYVNLNEGVSVAIHEDEIEYLAEQYDQIKLELNQ